MKLFIDCRMLGSGGIGTYLESILPYLISKYECTLLCYNKQNSQLTNYKDKVSILNTEIKCFSIKELFFFPNYLRKTINSCDIFYSPYCNIPSGIKIPIYSTIHDIVFLDLKGLTSTTGTIIRKFFYQHAINKSKAIFTVSKFSAERIRAKLNVRNTPLIVTYNSVPISIMNNNELTAVEKENFILFVGNIKKHKGLSTLLDALVLVRSKGLNIKLAIVGNSENFRSGADEIINKINNIKDGSIIFTGKISDTKLQEYYKKAKLLIQPSLYEGFGMPPMEALYSGTNVIISDIPVFKEIYGQLPVTFFKVEDADNLASKIIEMIDRPAPPSPLPDLYSFEKTSKIIMDAFNI